MAPAAPSVCPVNDLVEEKGGRVSKQPDHGAAFCFIIIFRAGAMRIDITDFTGIQSAVFQCFFHG